MEHREDVTLGPATREGEILFGVAQIFASFNDTFIPLLMLSTIATGLTIDSYGLISDNAGGIAEMAGMSHCIRERTDARDAARNTAATIGKVVDFYCKANDFSCVMKNRLDAMAKKRCTYKFFDITRPKNDFNCENRDWMTIVPTHLPTRSR
nr:zinc finger, PHD-type [Tanacetum cinerariifolium]